MFKEHRCYVCTTVYHGRVREIRFSDEAAAAYRRLDQQLGDAVDVLDEVLNLLEDAADCVRHTAYSLEVDGNRRLVKLTTRDVPGSRLFFMVVYDLTDDEVEIYGVEADKHPERPAN